MVQFTVPSLDELIQSIGSVLNPNWIGVIITKIVAVNIDNPYTNPVYKLALAAYDTKGLVKDKWMSNDNTPNHNSPPSNENCVSQDNGHILGFTWWQSVSSSGISLQKKFSLAKANHRNWDTNISSNQHLCMLIAIDILNQRK